MEKIEIPDFNKLLPNKKIISYNTTRLTEPGQNYGSTMLAVDIKTENTETKKEETLQVVAKLVPDNEFIQKMFQSPLTFKKELNFYRTIIPTLQQFQREQGDNQILNITSKFIGGRLGIKNENEFDTKAAIILENLKSEGYINVERTKGFDYETTKLIIRDIAALHAVPIALREKQPEVFEEKIRPYLEPLQISSIFSSTVREGLIAGVVQIAKEDEVSKNYIEFLENLLALDIDKLTPQTSEWFKSISHNDMWVNNTMVKFVDGVPIDNKIVDFQGFIYGSVAKDVVFFLFTSVQNDIFVENFDDFIDEYYTTFLGILKKYDVDVTRFTRELLEEEMGSFMRSMELFHCIFMLKPIFAEKENTRNVEDLSSDFVTEDLPASQLHKEKFWMIIRECAKRKWI